MLRRNKESHQIVDIIYFMSLGKRDQRRQACMNDWQNSVGNISKGTKTIKNNKGYKVLESHDRLCPEKTRQIEDSAILKIHKYYLHSGHKNSIQKVLIKYSRIINLQ